MKSKTNSPAIRFAQLGVLVLALFGFAQGASASSATHIIENTVTIAYSDAGSNVLGGTDTVAVTVRLVSGAPLVTVDPLGPLGPVAHNAALSFTYTITSNANGLDVYTLAENLNSPTDAALVSITTSPLSLGGANASTVSDALGVLDASDATDNTVDGYAITVAADDDGNGDGGEVHGFQFDDDIVFTPSGGSEYVCKVNHTVEPTAGNETNASATIYVDQCTTIGSGTLTAGDLVSERDTIIVVINSGTTNETVLLDASVTPAGEEIAGGGSVAGNATQVVIVVLGADLDVYKFVRNVTTSANNVVAAGLCTNGTDFQCLEIDSGEIYYKTGVQADPGDQLEYAVLLYNAASQVDEIVVTNPIVAFTAYDNDAGNADATLIFDAEAIDSDGTGLCTSGGSETGTCLVQAIGGGAPTSTAGTETSGDDWFEVSGGTVTASGGNDGAGAAVGNVAGGQLDAAVLANDERPASVVIFKVKVEG